MKVLLLLITGLITSLSLYAQDLSQVVQSVSPAIFRITTYDEDGEELSLATGFFISSDGRALTNYHVLKGAEKAIVKTDDNRSFTIDSIIGWSKASDLVEFCVRTDSGKSFSYLKPSDQKPKQGERIFVMGNPMGLYKSVSDGIVSSIRQDDSYGETIQITAPISQGSSGSPLMNTRGEVYGVVSYFLQSGQNLNFAVGIENTVRLRPVNASVFPPADKTEIQSDNATSDNVTTRANNRYSGSKLLFSTSPDNTTETCSSFYAEPDGGSIYVYLNNARPLATSGLIVDVYRRKGRFYSEFVERTRLSVSPEWHGTRFAFSFRKTGKYMVSVRDSKKSNVATGYVVVKKKR